MAVRIGVFAADRSLQIVLDVLDERLVVQIQQHGFVVHEHGEAVATVHQQERVRHQLVAPVHVEGLAVHQHVADAVLARHAAEFAARHLHRRRNVRAHGVREARRMLQSSAGLGQLRRAHFEGVEDVLAEGVHVGQLVVERLHVDEVAVRHVARLDVRADAAAVHESDIGHDAAMPCQREVRIGHEVAEVRLVRANGPGVVVVLEGDQAHVRAPDDAPGDLREIRLQPCDAGGRVGIDAVPSLDDAGGAVRRGCGDGFGAVRRVGGDGSGRGVDDHLADAHQLGARLRDQHRLAVLVERGLNVQLVRMAVDDHVDAARVRRHGRAGPARGHAALAQVRQRHHVVGTVGARLVDGALHGVVQLRAGVVLAKAVTVGSAFLEVGGGGLRQRLGRADAQERDLFSVGARVVFAHGVRVEHEVARAQVGEVAGQILRVRAGD